MDNSDLVDRLEDLVEDFSYLNTEEIIVTFEEWKKLQKLANDLKGIVADFRC